MNSRQQLYDLYQDDVDGLIEYCLLIEQQNAILQRTLDELKEKIAHLKRDSSTSNKPPSSDGPQKKRDDIKRRPSGRKPGGQKGHSGKARPIVPPEKIAASIPYKPSHCEQCHAIFTDKNIMAPVEHHQVWELPSIEPVIEQHVVYQSQCQCGHTTRASVPSWVYSGIGENAQAVLAYLTAVGQLTRRKTKLLFEHLFNFPISVGGIQNRLENSSKILKPTCHELVEALPDHGPLNIDETSYPHNGGLHWLWTFANAYFSVFVMNPKRSSKVLKKVLGIRFAGIITCDRFSAYFKFQKDRIAGIIQLCWAHILRDIKALRYAPDRLSKQPFALVAKQHIGSVFRLWHAFKAQKMTRKELIEKTKKPIARLQRLCEANTDSEHKPVRTLCNGLLKKWQFLFVFITHDGVEPTNNYAEQILRHGVITRKISYCTRSAAGQLLRARLLTVIQTCRIQKRNPLLFFRQAIHAHRHGLSPPSLLPNTEQIPTDEKAA